MVSPGEDKEDEVRKEVLPGFSTIEDFTQAGFKAVMEVTKISSKLPSGHNWDLYDAYPSFQKIMDFEGKRILEIMNMVLRHQGIRGNIVMRDLEEKFDLLVDCNDAVLERVGLNLDEISGIRKNPVPVIVESSGNTTRVVSGSWNRKISDSPQNKSPSNVPIRLFAAKNIERPQIKFKDKIDNSSNAFEPGIREKPNALKPLSILLELSENGEYFSHPYEYELDLFKAPEDQLCHVEPQKYRTLEETPLVMINTAEDVSRLLSDLKKYKEIAVDLEHHSYRTFQGFTCLMQISTRDTDYIIDTLELRNKLYILNEVFTDSKVVKVLHGAVSDIEWLQRDLCLYVVNMFDTHLAARMLNFAHLSLAYLLKHYCDIVVNKQFQLADWRIRPLPNELVNYAREDTHYLLYIYDLMKNSLIETANGQTNLLLSVIEQSRELCKKRYEKPMCTEDSHLDLYRKIKKMFDNRQMYAFRELYYWRDKIARDEDESIGYVLPNHMLMSIAEVLPREMHGILALCNPIPPLVRQNLVKLHQMILKAREQSLTRPVLEDETRLRPIAQVVWNKLDLESPLYCPHDMKFQQDFREDLPTILDPLGQCLIDTERSEPLQNTLPDIKLFVSDSEFEEESEENDTIRIQAGGAFFVSPYERYKRARPFIEAQEEKERQEELKSQSKNSTELNNEIPNKAKIKKPKEERKPALPFNKQISKRKRMMEENKANEMSSETRESRKKARVDGDSQATPSTSSGEILSKKENSVNQNAGPSKKKKKVNSKTHPSNKSEQMQGFDYSKVDFNKFQGGSVQLPKKENKGKFKPKGKKSKFIGKSNHKSLTFGSKGR